MEFMAIGWMNITKTQIELIEPYEIVKKLRKERGESIATLKEKSPGIPIIMITVYATINTALQATHLGAFDYIAKPFSKKEILAVLNRATDMLHSTQGDFNNNEAIPEESGQGKAAKQYQCGCCTPIRLDETPGE